jgi:hypothetical protein
MEGNVQITVGEALLGQLRAWNKLWSKLLAPVETENSPIVAEVATEPEDSGVPSGSRAEQAIVEASERSEGESTHV